MKAGDATQAGMLAEMEADNLKNQIFTTQMGIKTNDGQTAVTVIGEDSKLGDAGAQISAK